MSTQAARSLSAGFDIKYPNMADLSNSLLVPFPKDLLVEEARKEAIKAFASIIANLDDAPPHGRRDCPGAPPRKR